MAYRDYEYGSAEQCCSFRYLMPQLRKLLGAPNGAILDLGCGNGAIARVLLAEGHDVYGVDASETGIAIAAKEIPGRFFVQDISSRSLPVALSGKRFATVISTEVIEHLYDPRALVALARNVLNRGGGNSLFPRPTTVILKTWRSPRPASSMRISRRFGTVDTSSFFRGKPLSNCCPRAAFK